MNHGIPNTLIKLRKRMKGSNMCNYNYNSRNKIEKIDIHDSYFTGYSYTYDKREILLFCNNFENTKTFCFKFNNVIFSKMQSCNFWGFGDRIMYITTQDSMPYLDELKKNKHETYKFSYLDKKINFIAIEVLLNSGDMLIILCESMDYCEKTSDCSMS